MRKHIFGLALFIFIVASSVLIYGSFYYWTEYDNVSAKPLPERRAIKEIPEERPVSPDRLTNRVKSFTIDLEKGTGTVEVDMTWNSDEAPPPSGVRFDFGVVTPSEPTAEIQVGSFYIEEPFNGERSATKTCVFRLWGNPLDPKITNYYGYAELADREGVTNLVYTEKNRMAGAVQVLVKHPRKK
jgi:hypothetical protein